MNISTAAQTLVTDFTTKLAAQIAADARKAVETAFAGVATGTDTDVLSAEGAIIGSYARRGRKTRKPAANKTSNAKTTKTVAKGSGTGPKTRRTPEALDKDVGKLVAYLKKNPDSTSEVTRAALKWEKPIWLSTVSHALDTKKIAKKGEKRATTLRAR